MNSLNQWEIDWQYFFGRIINFMTQYIDMTKGLSFPFLWSNIYNNNTFIGMVTNSYVLPTNLYGATWEITYNKYGPNNISYRQIVLSQHAFWKQIFA